MRKAIGVLVTAAACLAMGMLQFKEPANAGSAPSVVPAFTHSNQNDWLNSPPLSLTSLRDKVVLVEFWTFDCINCLRSIPSIQAIQERFAGKDFQIVSVHTPELAHERRRANVVNALKRLEITYPVMLDTDFSYWNAMNNRYWPAFYLIDKSGALREIVVGEIRVGDARTAKLEKSISALLGEMNTAK
ncbi:MAG TPA: redoxin family protein [Steroidobacteraceae bacterium]|nr:redoxin family protein [Steroidobacteraceae bacterium]